MFIIMQLYCLRSTSLVIQPSTIKTSSQFLKFISDNLWKQDHKPKYSSTTRPLQSKLINIPPNWIPKLYKGLMALLEP